MGIKFYYTPMSSATAIHWALEELGLPYEKVKVNLAEGEQRKPDYLAINPNGKIPVVVIDGTVIFESLAILLYLGEAYGVEKGLFPAPGLKRAEAMKWLAWNAVTLGGALHMYMRNTIDRFPRDEQNPKAAEAAKEEIANLLGILDRHLKGKEYLLGSSFSLADTASGMTAFMTRFGIDLNPYANINAWGARCRERPALARVMQQG